MIYFEIFVLRYSLILFQLRAESIKQPEVDLEGIYRPISSKDKKQPTLQRNSEQEQQLQENGEEEQQPHNASVNEEGTLIDQKTEVNEEMLDLCVDNIEEGMPQELSVDATIESVIGDDEGASSSVTNGEDEVNVVFEVAIFFVAVQLKNWIR